MKNFTKIICLLILVSGSLNAQQERGIIGSNNWLNIWTEFMPNKVDYKENTHILSGNITEDTVLYKKYTYLLLGHVFVTNNAILSIEPGTVIMGDSKSKATLTITAGAGIIAEGTITDPIVFTSNNMTKKAGDWGGIIVLGDGYTETIGENLVTSLYADLDTSNYKDTLSAGETPKNNSGFISYMRIEYAGGTSQNSQVSNALLLAGVGTKTSINNVMVSYSAGNSVSVMGGDVNMEHMVSYKAKGNDYNFSDGATCNIYNSLAVRAPYVSSTDSRSINVVSYDNAHEVDPTKKETFVVAENMTLLTDTENVEHDIELGLIRESIYVGDHTNFRMERSVISGFNNAIMLDENIKINDASLSRIQLKNIYFNNCSKNIASKFKDDNEDLENWYGNPSFFNVYSKTNHSELFIDLNTSKKPDYRLRIDRILAMNKG